MIGLEDQPRMLNWYEDRTGDLEYVAFYSQVQLYGVSYHSPCILNAVFKRAVLIFSLSTFLVL